MIAQAIIGQLAWHYRPMLEAAPVALAVFEIWQVITMVASGINFGLLSRNDYCMIHWWSHPCVFRHPKYHLN
jgi:hypothetical protein